MRQTVANTQGVCPWANYIFSVRQRNTIRRKFNSGVSAQSREIILHIKDCPVGKTGFGKITKSLTTHNGVLL